jgi:anti-anti-sigma factor
MSAEPIPATDSATDGESLNCEVVPERETVRIRPVGSLDMATAGVLEARLSEVLGAGFQRVLLDLSGLDFMDSTGLRLVLRWDAAARADGFTLAVVPGSPTVQRVFEITGTTGHVPFVERG